jgi:hypothetical protein
VKKAELERMLDEGPFGGKPADPNTRLELIARFDEIYASIMGARTGDSVEGYRAADPHRPALTAHTENIARTWGTRLFGKWQH